jgi:hypothetical protein
MRLALFTVIQCSDDLERAQARRHASKVIGVFVLTTRGKAGPLGRIAPVVVKPWRTR